MKNVSQETIDLALSFVRAKVGQKPDGTDFTFEDMVSPNRQRFRVNARMYFCWFLRVNKRFSFPHIALILKRDHSSIMHLVEKCNLQQGLERSYPLADWRKGIVLSLLHKREEISFLYAKDIGLDTISEVLKIPVDHIRSVLLECGLRETHGGSGTPQYLEAGMREMADA